MNEIRHNPFRYLGVFANATLKEQTAQATRIKAFARVGQKIDNPLRLCRLLGPLPGEEECSREAESLLAFPQNRERYAAFWFVHGPNPDEDLEAVRLLDQGRTSKALSIWSRRVDKEAVQNLMVAYLVLKKWEQAVRVAQQLYHHEHDICRFATAVASGTNMKTRQMARLSADNPQWDAVLKDMLVETCRKRIEQCLDDVDRDCNEDTLEALYVATAGFDDLRSVLGDNDVVYLTLAERAANALSPKYLMKFSTRQILNYLHKAFDLAVDEQTKSRVAKWIFDIYSRDDVPSRWIRKDIPGARKVIKKEHFEIGCGAIGFLLFIIIGMGRTCSSSYNRSQPPKIPEYHKIEVPSIPSINIPTIPKIEIPDKRVPLNTTPELPKLSEEDLEKLREMNKKSDNPMTDEEWERVTKELFDHARD